MSMHSVWAHDLAREQLDGARLARIAEDARKLRALKHAAEADLAALKAMAERFGAKDTSFDEIAALLNETCAGIESAIQDDG